MDDEKIDQTKEVLRAFMLAFAAIVAKQARIFALRIPEVETSEEASYELGRSDALHVVVRTILDTFLDKKPENLH